MAESTINIQSISSSPSDANRIERAGFEIQESSSNSPDYKVHNLREDYSDVSVPQDSSRAEKGAETVLEICRRVYRERKLSQADFDRIEYQYIVGNIIAVIAFYGTMYVCSAMLLKTENPLLVAMPWGDNKTVLILVTITFCATFGLITVCTGLCIWKREHPLVRARGLIFVAGVGITALGVAVLQYCIILTYFLPNLWEGRKHFLNIYLAMADYVVVTVTLGLIIARAGVIYRIFIRPPGSGIISYNWYFAKVVGGMVMFAICAFTPFVVATVQGWKGAIYYLLIALIPWEVAIASLSFYSYQTRDVSPSFSDWKSNCRIGIVLALASNVIVLSMVIDFGAPNYGVLPSSFELFVFFYASLAKIAYTVLDLFALLAVISVCDLKIVGKLNPKQSTFAESSVMECESPLAVKHSRDSLSYNASSKVTLSTTAV